MILPKDKFKDYHCSQYRSIDESKDDIRTMSLQEVYDSVQWMLKNAKANNVDPHLIPCFIETEKGFKYCVDNASIGSGRIGTICTFSTVLSGQYNNLVHYVAPDIRPEEGEYWTSRGVTPYDVSGFVKSKVAGERLLRMVKLVLETDEPISYLDYRETEPDWIQFKFSPKEFDIKKLEEMADRGVDDDGIITLEILYKCKK